MAARELSKQIEFWLNTFDEPVMLGMLYDAAEKVGLRLLEIAGDEYPPEPPNQAAWRGKMLHTDKQKRWWWATMRSIAEGGPVPDSLHGWRAAYRKIKGVRTLVVSGGYKRTGTLVRGLNYEVEADRGGATVAFGPTLARGLGTRDLGAYAMYVIGRPPIQHPIHRDRWTPIDDLIDEHIDELFQIFSDDLIRQIDDRNANLRPGRSVGD